MSKTTASAKSRRHPHLDHLDVIGVLAQRGGKPYPRDARREAQRELTRYRDEGLILQQDKDNNMKPMTKSGFCQHESPGSHAMCSGHRCDCECHFEPKTFSGQGILFAVIDEQNASRKGKTTTVQVIADAIEGALDAGKETSDEIARHLTTSAFKHEPDKRVRFNSVLKAGDGVGAHIVKKLINSYNELMDTAESEKDKATREALVSEATGFAEAIQIMLNPFSVEDPKDATLVSWDELDHLTELFTKEQAAVRKYKEKK